MHTVNWFFMCENSIEKCTKIIEFSESPHNWNGFLTFCCFLLSFLLILLILMNSNGESTAETKSKQKTKLIGMNVDQSDAMLKWK